MKIGFIGVGNMGGSILKGYLGNEQINPKDIYVCDSDEEKVRQMEETLGINGCSTIEDLTAKSDIIIAGVKPNSFELILPKIASEYTEKKIIVSMAAGIDISYIEKFFDDGVKVVRIMPNTAAMVNEAMVAVCRNNNVGDIEFEEVFKLFKAIGLAEEISEELIHCVIGVSGSSPAYTYMYIDALAEAAVENGMAKEQAIIFAAQAVMGAAKMVLETGINPVQLRINVCSPGGTTIEAVNTLKANGFEKNIKEGFQAAVDKSKLMVKK
ncbi:MAG: pyrroline-5-carboxylate reductase [Peptostreptococcaceae bacterium]|nr:pyrroline-5-carboxylate reductase [Peptostreptococcaceae bacterium]